MAAEDPAVRVGDTERRAADERLQRAHGEGRLTLAEYEERSAGAWAARTRADLDALTADLPAPGPAVPAAAGPVAVDRDPGAPAWVRRAGGLLGTLVVGAAVLWGGGQLLGRDDGAAVFGSRTIALAPGDDRVELGFLFGSTDVVVPDDARVVVNGAVVFGSVDCDAACSGTGVREITVDASGAFGSVDVRTASEAAAADRDDDRDDDGDDD
ncbi:hypothetical protein GCM10017691_59180 [Pseudonocardia petroleophila]|uniref:DUF1707 and DUF2154 domain-containing protein n=1 Tax=Pseudonocardia petroleophila TaxID=37331 RepID=A0A7G7MMQ8_9PSEU|nr:DUF1707 domain-containing protein [Pseudonocardia petroleophila]QNG54069.1 DUF1707 and DUF2154 domain-containing protein [Pseudonocardia petroleophila]